MLTDVAIQTIKQLSVHQSLLDIARAQQPHQLVEAATEGRQFCAGTCERNDLLGPTATGQQHRYALDKARQIGASR